MCSISDPKGRGYTEHVVCVSTSHRWFPSHSSIHRSQASSLAFLLTCSCEVFNSWSPYLPKVVVFFYLALNPKTCDAMKLHSSFGFWNIFLLVFLLLVKLILLWFLLGHLPCVCLLLFCPRSFSFHTYTISPANTGSSPIPSIPPGINFFYGHLRLPQWQQTKQVQSP